jgi:hypothetical protein
MVVGIKGLASATGIGRVWRRSNASASSAAQGQDRRIRRAGDAVRGRVGRQHQEPVTQRFGSAVARWPSRSRRWVQAMRSTSSITTVSQAALVASDRDGKWSRPVSCRCGCGSSTRAWLDAYVEDGGRVSDACRNCPYRNRSCRTGLISLHVRVEGPLGSGRRAGCDADDAFAPNW